jgi:hypothetical protein
MAMSLVSSIYNSVATAAAAKTKDMMCVQTFNGIAAPHIQRTARGHVALPPRPVWRADMRDCLQCTLEMLRRLGVPPPTLVGAAAASVWVSGAPLPWQTTIHLVARCPAPPQLTSLTANKEIKIEELQDGFICVASISRISEDSISVSSRTEKDMVPIKEHAHWRDARCVVSFRPDHAAPTNTKVAAVDGCAPVRIATSPARALQLLRGTQFHEAPEAGEQDRCEADIRRELDAHTPPTWKWNSAAKIWEPCIPLTNPSVSLIMPALIVAAVFLIIFYIAIYIDKYLMKKAARYAQTTTLQTTLTETLHSS